MLPTRPSIVAVRPADYQYCRANVMRRCKWHLTKTGAMAASILKVVFSPERKPTGINSKYQDARRTLTLAHV
jgi:hypothetical protein